MLMYALIGLSLVLVGVSGLQFSYLFYADRLNKERRKHLADLEHKCAVLSRELEASELRVAEQQRLLESLQPLAARDEETWADVID